MTEVSRREKTFDYSGWTQHDTIRYCETIRDQYHGQELWRQSPGIEMNHRTARQGLFITQQLQKNYKALRALQDA